MSQHQFQEVHGSPATNNMINGRYYESPAPMQGMNESVNLSYGGCFNKLSSWTPARNGNGFGSSECPSAPKLAARNAQTPYSSGSWRSSNMTSTPRRPHENNDGVRLRLVDFNDTFNSTNTFSNSFNTSRSSAKCTLPTWAADAQGGVAPSVTLQDVIDNQALFEFAADKNGCRFLQEHYPMDGGLHDEIFRKMVEDRAMFLSMCRNMFGNFFIQRIVEFSRTEEQEIVMEHLVTDMFALCLDKSACRVIQLAVQKLEIHLASRLATQLRDTDLVRLSIDQNGNHVIQKIIKTLPVSAWDYLVDFFSNDDNLIAVCQDKYGCRVIQSTIEKLSESETTDCVLLLQQLMDGIVRNCPQLASNEFANYVIQHVIKCDGGLETYRDVIIEKCLLRNLLSMSQEKYASHVVEIAFSCAPHRLLCEMMEEIFEGYIPHPETNRDALDILLFHQYGNYVIQQMIHICCSAIQGERFQEHGDIELYSGWLERIKERVFRNSARLERFSSGKKILEALHAKPCLEMYH